MKAQLVVGRGDGDLWSIPGVSADFERPGGILTTNPRFVWLLSVFIFVTVFLVGFKFFRS